MRVEDIPSRFPYLRDTGCSRTGCNNTVARFFLFFLSRVRDLPALIDGRDFFFREEESIRAGSVPRRILNTVPRYDCVVAGTRVYSRNTVGNSVSFAGALLISLFRKERKHEHPRTPLSARSLCTRVRNTTGHCSDASLRCVTSGRFIDAHSREKSGELSRGEGAVKKRAESINEII